MTRFVTFTALGLRRCRTSFVRHTYHYAWCAGHIIHGPHFTYLRLVRVTGFATHVSILDYTCAASTCPPILLPTTTFILRRCVDIQRVLPHVCRVTTVNPIFFCLTFMPAHLRRHSLRCTGLHRVALPTCRYTTPTITQLALFLSPPHTPATPPIHPPAIPLCPHHTAFAPYSPCAVLFFAPDLRHGCCWATTATFGVARLTRLLLRTNVVPVPRVGGCTR